MEDQTPAVGDTYSLGGHCMVVYPDGTVATASREITFKAPGEYEIIYEEDDRETVVVTDAVAQPSVTMDALQDVPTSATTATEPAEDAGSAPVEGSEEKSPVAGDAGLIVGPPTPTMPNPGKLS